MIAPEPRNAMTGFCLAVPIGLLFWLAIGLAYWWLA